MMAFEGEEARLVVLEKDEGLKGLGHARGEGDRPCFTHCHCFVALFRDCLWNG